MKVYLIVSGLFSDHRVDYVKLNREEAEKVCAVMNEEVSEDCYYIEEHDTDDINVDTDIEVKKAYMVSDHYGIRIDKPIYTVSDINKLERYNINGEEWISGTATFPKSISDENAHRIIQDRVAKFKAEKEGIC